MRDCLSSLPCVCPQRVFCFLFFLCVPCLSVFGVCRWVAAPHAAVLAYTGNMYAITGMGGVDSGQGGRDDPAAVQAGHGTRCHFPTTKEEGEMRLRLHLPLHPDVVDVCA